jgi:hypothetical protein
VAGPPASLTPSGTPQSAVINTAYATMQVTVKDASGNLLSGVPVTFTAPVSGASGTFVGSTSVNSNASGVAAAPMFTANGTIGAFTVTASSGALSATFNLTNKPIPIAGIAVESGTGQGISPGGTFSFPLVARVFDTNGVGVPNAPVTFTMPASGATATFAGSGATFTTNTNSQGLAATPLMTAGSAAGNFVVTASTTGGFSTTFTLNIGAPPGYSVSPGVLIFRWEVGQPLPPSQTATVVSPENRFTLAVDVPWVKAASTPHGILNDTVTVSVDPSNLPLGNYTGIVTVGDGAFIRVSLQVVPKPQFNPSATSLNFQYRVGDGIPSEQLVYVTAMSRNFNFIPTTSYVTPTTVQWLRVVGDGGTFTTPQPLHVSIAPSGLDPGTYQAKIRLTSADATNSPLDITVTLVVTAAATNGQ